uniref:Carboxylic ester hydrolase n=2 Tax=Tetranychus urticae TaxID=32264 RepID=D8V7K0_TETUR|nr:acetylcholinesterase precursor [Tetranychus urticae]
MVPMFNHNINHFNNVIVTTLTHHQYTNSRCNSNNNVIKRITNSILKSVTVFTVETLWNHLLVPIVVILLFQSSANVFSSALPHSEINSFYADGPSSSSSFNSEHHHHHHHNDPLVVLTKKGYVRGRSVVSPTGKPVDAFLGIRYAKPPTGKFRFRHPKPIDSWQGIFNATSFSGACYQVNDTFFGNFMGATEWNPNVPLDEDCLSVNIWVPRPRPKSAAVLLWIYGGGFWSGSSSLDFYDGSVLAGEESIIFVSINYRVASLGFIFFDTSDAPGNAGLFDQLMAMEWIRENIAAFGGNPANITIFGESSGAVSAALHLLSPLSRNVFSQAILQSGSATCPWAISDRKKAYQRSLALAQAVGCGSTSTRSVHAIIECMQSIPASELVAQEEATTGVVEFAFIPIVDGSFLDEDPEVSLRTKNFKHTPILTGSNRDEATYWLVYHSPHIFNLSEGIYISRSEFQSLIRIIYPHLSPLAQEAVIQEYTHWINPDDQIENREATDKFVGDYHFTCPVNEMSYRYALYGNDVWTYHFTHRSSKSFWPSWMGVIHGEEIKFVLGEPLDPVHGYTPAEVQLSKRIMRYWANFARTGNPNKQFPDGDDTESIVWPEYTAHEKEYLVISTNDSSIGRGLRAKQCAFWKNFLPKLINALENRHNSTCTSHSNQIGSSNWSLAISLISLIMCFLPSLR